MIKKMCKIIKEATNYSTCKKHKIKCILNKRNTKISGPGLMSTEFNIFFSSIGLVLVQEIKLKKYL